MNDIRCNHGDNCICSHELTPEPKVEGWEKVFDKEIVYGGHWFVGDVKQFISTLLAQREREVVEILKKAKVECAGSCGAGCEYAVEDLISKLKEGK